MYSGAMVAYPIVYLLYTYTWEIDHASLIHNVKNASVCVCVYRWSLTCAPHKHEPSFLRCHVIHHRRAQPLETPTCLSTKPVAGRNIIKLTIFSQVTQSGDHGGIAEFGNSRRWFGGLSRSQSECVLQTRPLYRPLSFTHTVDRDSQAAESSNRGRGHQCGLLTWAKC